MSGGGDVTKPYIGMPAERMEQKRAKGGDTALFLRQDEIYNRTKQKDSNRVERDPDRIAEIISKQAESRGTNKQRTADNIINAQAVQRRADAAEKQRTERIEGLIERFPYMQRAPYNIRRRP